MSVTKTALDQPEVWPALPPSEWAATYATLHMWTQIVGKVRMALCPRVNHWWEVPLYVSARGLVTSPIPYGNEVFDVEFNFIDHKLDVVTSGGKSASIALKPQTVADFYAEFMATLHLLGIDVKIWNMPQEVPEPIRFEQDRTHASYDAEYAHLFWRILVNVDSVFKEFRAKFVGKVSPVHFFWGSFDICVTRFSGRRAPERPNADRVTREAYSHEVISVGFWPGGGDVKGAAFYAYAAPPPPGFEDQAVRPAAAFYHKQMGEFLLMYDDLRTSTNPRADLLEFCQSTYEAGAKLGNWDRAGLEKGA